MAGLKISDTERTEDLLRMAYDKRMAYPWFDEARNVLSDAPADAEASHNR